MESGEAPPELQVHRPQLRPCHTEPTKAGLYSAQAASKGAAGRHLLPAVFTFKASDVKGIYTQYCCDAYFGQK